MKRQSLGTGLGFLASLAMLLTACPQSTGGSSACDRAAAYTQRCNAADGGTPQCQINDQRNACASAVSLYRSEYINAAASCYTDTLACGQAGQDQLTACFNTATATLSLSDAHRALATAVCSRCATATLPQAQCEAQFTGTADGGTSASGFSVRVLSDQSAAQLTACVNAVPTGAADSCQRTVNCLTSAVPMPDAGASSCGPDV